MNLLYSFAQNSDLYYVFLQMSKMYSSGRVLTTYTNTASLIATCIMHTTLPKYCRNPSSFSARDKQLNTDSSPAG